MINGGLFLDRLYQETVVLVLGLIVLIGLILYFLRRKSSHFLAGWASVKSWFFMAPLILFLLGLPQPWPVAFLTLASIFSMKVFFQMSGMYHRSWFVWSSYIFSLGLGLLAYQQNGEVYNIAPMVFLGAIAWIPLLRNNYEHMIQYIALTLLAFIFFGWSFLHLAKLIVLERGAYIVIYLYILTEISENVSLSASRIIGKHKLFNKISQRVTFEGLVASVIVTVLIAWAMRHLLPDRSEKYWIAAGLAAAILGRFGDLFLSVVRRDLGIRETGVFIFGRDDILARVDKLIFVGPIYYYLYLILQKTSLS